MFLLTETSADKNHPEGKESKEASSQLPVKFAPTEEKPSLMSPNDFAKDLIDFQTESSDCSDRETISKRDRCLGDFKTGQRLASNDWQTGQEAAGSLNTTECTSGNAFKSVVNSRPDTTTNETPSVFDLIDIGDSHMEKPLNLQLSNDCNKSGNIKRHEMILKKEDNKPIVIEDPKDSTAYVNELFMSTLPPSTPSEMQAVTTSLRRGSFVEENGELLELNSRNISSQGDSGSVSPTTLRLQRIGFCEYMSQETLANNDDKRKITLVESVKSKITSNDTEVVKMKTEKSDELKIVEEICETGEVKGNDIQKSEITPNDSGKAELLTSEVELSQRLEKTTNATEVCLMTSSTSAIVAQCKLETATPCESKILKQSSERESKTSVQKGSN